MEVSVDSTHCRGQETTGRIDDLKEDSGSAGLLHSVRSKSEEGCGSLRSNRYDRIVGSYNLHGVSVDVPDGEIGDKSYQDGHNQIGLPILRQHRMSKSKNSRGYIHILRGSS